MYLLLSFLLAHSPHFEEMKGLLRSPFSLCPFVSVHLSVYPPYFLLEGL
jgi:hypothetical protein